MDEHGGSTSFSVELLRCGLYVYPYSLPLKLLSTIQLQSVKRPALLHGSDGVFLAVFLYRDISR